MANVTAAMVKDLREKTGAGMMDCKNALGETEGNIEAAIDWLRKKGLSKAAKNPAGLLPRGSFRFLSVAPTGSSLRSIRKRISWQGTRISRT